MASPAEVDEEPPEPSELRQEPLSGQKRCVWATSDGDGGAAPSGSGSRLLDFISFFSFRVIQLPRLQDGEGKKQQVKDIQADINVVKYPILHAHKTFSYLRGTDGS